MPRFLISAITICIAVSRTDAAIVDTFTVPATDTTIAAVDNGFNSTTQNGLSTTEVIGGSRYFSVDGSISKANTFAEITATMNGNDPDPSFDISYVRPGNGNNVFTGTNQIIWGNLTDLNADFGTDTDFILTLQDPSLSPINVINAQLSLTLESGTGSDTVNLDLLSGGFLQPDHRFSGFTGIDFSDIDRITLTLTSSVNKFDSNFTVSYGAFASAAAIPEPSSYLLLGLTAIAGGVTTRRKRRQTTESVPEKCDTTPTI